MSELGTVNLCLTMKRLAASKIKMRASDAQRLNSTPAFQNIGTCVDYRRELERGVLMTPTASHLPDSTPHSSRSVWRRPRKEPLVDVDRAIFVAIHHQAAVLVLTAIHPLPQGHVLLTLADMTHPGRIAFIDHEQVFPEAQTLVRKHLYKAVKPPIIIYHAIAYVPLPSFFGGLALLFLDDHLLLGKIADHHSPFSQLVCDEMRGFMQTVALLTLLAFRYPPVDFREMNISAGLLLAFISFGADLVELTVIPAVALEAADVVEPPLVVDARCQRFDTQVKGHDAIIAQGALLASLACLALIDLNLLRIIVDERTVIVPAHIPGNSCCSERCAAMLG